MTTQAAQDRRIFVYDTTLRDGAQGEEISFTYEDKIRIARRCDEVGFDYIEGGYPGSNPRDRKFFKEMRKVPLKHAKLVAFGMTMRTGAASPADDPMLQTLLEAETPTVCLVGKSWDLHVTEALRSDLEAYLDAVAASVRWIKEHGREVVFDAEHFFDGMAHNRTYAMRVLQAAVDGGADWLVLCDTNGGSMVEQVARDVADVVAAFSVPVGIHTHNDAELAVANSLVAVNAGARQVQGTIGGIGERCGNANLISVVADLSLKLGFKTLTPAGLSQLTDLTNFVMELANLPHPRHLPYVGASAFAHKGGMHVSGIRRNPITYEHIDPAWVGNRRRILVSDLAGKATILEKLPEYGIDVDPDDPRVAAILERLKELESVGYQYEGAEASFELLIRRHFGLLQPAFELEEYEVVDRRRGDSEPQTTAAVSVRVGGQTERAVAGGNGPVNALDHALRQALVRFYPAIRDVRLIDYKVRVLAAGSGTEAVVRVLIESGDEYAEWGTVGVGTNVIDASYEALRDALDYKLLVRDAATASHARSA